MILWFSAHDYTRGLEANLLAELIGLLVGIGATYLIVDRVVARRLKARQRPLLARFKRSAVACASLLAFGWALRLGLGGLHDGAERDPDLVSRALDAVSKFAADPAGLLTEIRRYHQNAAFSIAKETVDTVAMLSAAADRLDQILEGHLDVLSDLADLEDTALVIAQSLKERIDDGIREPMEIALMGLSRVAFQKAVSLRNRLEDIA